MSHCVSYQSDSDDAIETAAVSVREKRIGESMVSDLSEESQTLLPVDNESMIVEHTVVTPSADRGESDNVSCALRPSRAAQAGAAAAILPEAPAAHVSPAAPNVSSSCGTCTGRHPHVAHEEDELACCICLEGYSSDNPMSRGTCNHHFHFPCLMEWKQRSNTCPLCCAETLYLSDERLEAEAAAERAASELPPVDVSRDEELAQRLQRHFAKEQRKERRAAEERRKAAVTRAQPTTATRSDADAVALRPRPQTVRSVPRSPQPKPTNTTPTPQQTLPPIGASSSSRSKPQVSSNQKDNGQCIAM